jgi:predicted DNA-binding transcriptional regulator AlpA
MRQIINDFITALFCRADAVMIDVPKHPNAHLYSSEIITLALLFALKGMSQRAFYRWISRNDRSWFPGLPERTRLFRLFDAHADWAEHWLADPTLLGVIESYGIELVIPGAKTARTNRLAARTTRTIAGSSEQNCHMPVEIARVFSI